MSRTERGADAVIAALKAAGTRHVFTLSGNQIMPIFDASIDSGIRLIHVRHEAAAVHMADAWGRLTGRPGVALVTAGPGMANCLSALYVARMAESPLVLFSGQSPLRQQGRGAFQEMAQAEMASPVTKASWTAPSTASLSATVQQALQIAASGRPGPVHVGLPFDILEAAHVPDSRGPSRGVAHSPLNDHQAHRILAALRQAKRPLILAGPAMMRHDAAQSLSSFEALTSVPVIGMESPRGVNDPSLGALAEILPLADCVLLWGKQLDFTLQINNQAAFAPRCRFLQVDPDREVLELTHRILGDPARIVLMVQADTRAGSTVLCRAAAAESGRCRESGDAAVPSDRQTRTNTGPPSHLRHSVDLGSDCTIDPSWLSEVRAALTYRPPTWEEDLPEQGGRLHSTTVCRAVQAYLRADEQAVCISDGGEFGQWAQACIQAPRRLINGPAGSIGVAIPFALAARLAYPEARIVTLLGDGTFGFHALEFDTAIRYELPFIAVLGNDAMWNAEYQIQLRKYGADRTVGCQLLPTSYEQLVQAVGGYGELVKAADQLTSALDRARAAQLPSCLNVALQNVAAPIIRRPQPPKPV